MLNSVSRPYIESKMTIQLERKHFCGLAVVDLGVLWVLKHPPLCNLKECKDSMY